MVAKRTLWRCTATSGAHPGDLCLLRAAHTPVPRESMVNAAASLMCDACAKRETLPGRESRLTNLRGEAPHETGTYEGNRRRALHVGSPEEVLDVSCETLQKHAASPLHAQDSSARAVAAGSPRSPRRGGPSPAMPPNTTATRARQVSTYSCTSVDNSEEYADLRGRHPHRRAQTV